MRPTIAARERASATNAGYGVTSTERTGTGRRQLNRQNPVFELARMRLPGPLVLDKPRARPASDLPHLLSMVIGVFQCRNDFIHIAFAPSLHRGRAADRALLSQDDAVVVGQQVLHPGVERCDDR